MNQVETVIIPAIAKLHALGAEIGGNHNLLQIIDIDGLMRAAEGSSRDLENLSFEQSNLQRDIRDARAKLVAAYDDIAKREAERSIMARRLDELHRLAADAERRADTYRQRADEGLRVAQDFQTMVIDLKERRFMRRLKRWIGLAAPVRA